jgi:hypothetical protein
MALNDINQLFSITDPETGKPTDYLMRLLRDRGVAVGSLEEQVLLKADKSISVTASGALEGGGTLDADFDIALNPLAVSPAGSFVNATVTVDTYGRVTAASRGTLHVALTQAAYDAIGTKDPETFYYIIP